MSQIQALIANIDDLTSTIINIGEKINRLSVIKPPPLTFSDINGSGMFKFMTNRQIAKKMIMLGGSQIGLTITPVVNQTLNTTPGAAFIPQPISNQINNIDINIAHLTVYGKFLYDSNGNLIDDEITYPECVAGDGEGEGGVNHMPGSFPMLEMAKEMKNDFQLAISGLRIKGGEIGQAFIDMQFQLILAVTTLASAATILPPGSGLPTALSAIKAIPTALMAFQTRIMQIIPYLKPLGNLAVLLPDESMNAAIVPINTILSIIKKPFDVLDLILSLVTALSSATPPVPGADGVTPAEPMVVEVTANPTLLMPSDAGIVPVQLKASVSKGSWQYAYSWSSIPVGGVTPTGWSSTKKEVTVFPTTSTRYICKVTDTKLKTSKTSEVTVSFAL